MGIQAYVNVDKARKMAECTGIDCKDSESVNKAIDVLMDKTNPPPTPDKKVKGKLKPIKPMAHQAHEHETLDKEALKKEIIAELAGNKTADKPDPHQEIIKNLHLGENFGECKGCNTKLQNPTIAKKFKSCPSCHNNAVHPERKICPTCGDTPEEWGEDGIELED